MSVKSQSLGRNRNRMVDSTPYTPTHTSNYATIPANQGLVKLKKSYSTAPNSVYREVRRSNIQTLAKVTPNPTPKSTKALPDSPQIPNFQSPRHLKMSPPRQKINSTILY